jgi:RNA polymerase sigma factor (sigma-70 family)
VNTTRKSLLARVRDPGDHDAWTKFYDLYAPLLYGFARKQGLDPGDAEEVRDQVLEELSRKMPGFCYDRERGRFKSWLYRMTAHRVVDLRRRARAGRADSDALAELVDPGPTPSEAWERNWESEHLRYCVERARFAVSERDWQAFRLLVDDKTVPEVCSALGMNPNQVYKAKHAVLARVREIRSGLG